MDTDIEMLDVFADYLNGKPAYFNVVTVSIHLGFSQY